MGMYVGVVVGMYVGVYVSVFVGVMGQRSGINELCAYSLQGDMQR